MCVRMCCSTRFFPRVRLLPPHTHSRTCNMDARSGAPTRSARSEVGGVEHDSHRRTESASREVAGKLGAASTVGAVGTGDLAPDHAVLGAVLQGARLVDVRNTLAKVERGLLLGVDALKLQKAGVLVTRALGAARTGSQRRAKRSKRAVRPREAWHCRGARLTPCTRRTWRSRRACERYKPMERQWAAAGREGREKRALVSRAVDRHPRGGGRPA
jgi:hypothetical protein